MTCKDKPIKIIADFSSETLKARRAWSEVFWALKENNFCHKILYPAKLLFKIERIIKILQDKQKLKQYLITKLPLQKSLKGILHTEDENKHSHWRMRIIKPHKKSRQVIRVYHRIGYTCTNPHTTKTKMTGITTYLIILTLNVNGLNSPSKRHWLANWINKKELTICVYKKLTLQTRHKNCLRVKGWKKIYQTNAPENRQE
jgi:hypothetical protein